MSTSSSDSDDFIEELGREKILIKDLIAMCIKDSTDEEDCDSGSSEEASSSGSSTEKISSGDNSSGSSSTATEDGNGGQWSHSSSEVTRSSDNTSSDEDEGEDDFNSIEVEYQLTPEEEKFRHIICSRRCFACYEYLAIFRCEQCKRSFHKQCAFYKDPYPKPEFDQPYEVLVTAKEGEAKLLRCVECVIAEKTQVPALMNVPQEQLAKGFKLVAKSVYKGFKDKKQSYVNTTTGKATTLKKIKTRAKNGRYKTFEGFYAAFKQLLFDTQFQFGRFSLEFAIALNMARVATLELKVMGACLNCYLQRYDSDGRLLKHEELYKTMQYVCEMPHPLVWVKQQNYPYWPAKLLHATNEEGQFKVSICTFGDAKIWHDFEVVGRNLLEFSQKRRSKSQNTKLKKAIVDCNAYIENCRSRFGTLVFSGNPNTKFEDSLDIARKKMFPDFYKETNAEIQDANGAAMN